MNRTALLVAALVLSAASDARAIPGWKNLEQLASGECSAAECFDGAPVLRREPPVVILEEKKVGEHYVPPHWQPYNAGLHCHPEYGHFHGHYHYNYSSCHDPYRGGWVPGKLFTTFDQRVGIEDRAGYVSKERRQGRREGGIFGAIFGLLGLLGGPQVGLGMILAGAVVGMLVGGKKAARKAENKPRIFDRTVTTERVVDSYPSPQF